MGKREAGTIFISLQLATEELQAKVRSLDKEFKKIGNSAKQVGQSLSLAFTLPLAAIGKSAVSSFAEFDQAMQNSIAFMGEAGETMRKELVQGAMDIASTTTISAKEAADGYGVLAQAGLNAADSIAALPIVADFATAGQMRLADATTTLVQIQKSLGLSAETPIENAKQLAHVGDVLTRASLDTTVSIQDLSSALASQLGGSLRLANVSLETGAAMLEAFGSQGIKGAKAGTALGIVIRELGIDFLKHSDAFKKAGIEVYDANGNYKNMIGIIEALEKKTKGMSDAQQVAQIMQLGFTKKNAQFIQSLIGMSEAMKIWEKRNQEATGEMSTMATKMRATFQAQMQMAMNNVKNLGIIIGGDLAPKLLDLTQKIVNLAGKFKELTPEVRGTVEAFAVIVALLGPIQYIFGTIAKGVSGLSAALIFLLKPFKWLLTGITAAVAAFGIIPVALGVALISAAALAYSYWDEIKGVFQDFIDWFSATFPGITTVFEGVWALMNEMVEVFMDDMATSMNEGIDLAISLWGKLPGAVKVAWEFINTMTDIFVGDLEWAIGGFLDWFAEMFPSVSEVAGKVWKEITRLLTEEINQIKADWQDVADTVALAGEYARKGWAWATGNAASIKKEIDARNVARDAAKRQADETRRLAEEGKKSEKVIGSTIPILLAQGKFTDGATASTKKHTEAVGENTTANESEAESLEETLQGFQKVDKGAKKAADAIGQLNKKLLEAQGKTLGKDLEADLDAAVSHLNTQAFGDLKAQLADSIRAGADVGLKELVAKAGTANKAVAEGLVKQIGDAKVETAFNEWERKFAEEKNKQVQEQLEKEKEAHKESAEYWREVFTNATSDSVTDMKTNLKEIFVGFAAEIASAMSGGVKEGAKSVADIGASLAKGLIGLFSDGSSQSGSGLSGWLQDIFKSGMSTDQAHASGVEGPGMANGSFSGPGAAPYIQAGAQAIGAIINASKTDKANKDNSGTGGAIGAAAGAYWGPIGSSVGQAIGTFVGGMMKWGPQNPETQARHAFANFVEEGFAKLKTVSFYDAQGKLKQQKGSDFNFLEGDSTKFNDPKWAEKINSMGKEARGTFLGLGQALEETLELTEEVGGQIGSLLAENLGGNIDNARLFVQQLGLSMDDLIEKLIQTGVTGEATWLEVETGIQGVTEAFKPGLAAFGDVKGAFEELKDSGGRGVAALKAVKDIAVEVMEAGGKTLDDLKRKMLENGVDPAEVESFMAALSQRQIKSLQELSEVSNRVGGGIVADINASSKTMADTWSKMSEQLEDVSQKLKNIPAQIQSSITLTVDADISESAQSVIDAGVAPGLEIPSATKKFAKGGLLNRPTFFNTGAGLGLAGEAGPEVLMPAQIMADGKMGVRVIGSGRNDRRGGGMNIYVNAPNASPGMEHRIADSIRRIGEQAVSQAVDAVDRRASRGGRY